MRRWVRRAAAPSAARVEARRNLGWIALASGVLALLLVLAAYSPLLRIRTISWTGPLVLSESAYRQLEQASLGRPLYLFSEKSLRRSLAVNSRAVRVRFVRRLPATLEVNLAPRKAIALFDAETALDAQGRRLGAEHALAGLPLLAGFELEPGGKRLVPRDGAVLGTVHGKLSAQGFQAREIRLGKHAVEVALAGSGARVRLDPVGLDEQLEKLRVYEAALGEEPLPANIDLRFAGRVVVRERGVAHASRRAR